MEKKENITEDDKLAKKKKNAKKEVKNNKSPKEQEKSKTSKEKTKNPDDKKKKKIEKEATEKSKKIKEDSKEKTEKKKNIENDEKKSEDIKPVKEKKSHKKIIIGIVVVIAIFVLAIGGYFLKQYLDLKSPIKDTWGQTYYVYLKDAKEKKKTKEAGLSNDMKNTKLKFYELNGIEDPVMVMTYKKTDNNYTNIYYIENNKVNTLIYQEPTTIELLYNITTKEYDYYTHTNKDNQDSYKSLSEQIKEQITELETEKNETDKVTDIAQVPEYTFGKDEVESITDINGNTIAISKIDTVFIKPEIKKEKGTDYKIDLEEKKLKEAVITTISNYEPQKNIVTAKIKEKVEDQAEKIKTKQEEMKKAASEVEALKITPQNIQTKLGEHLKWFSAAYLGVIYGWPMVFKYKDVTNSVTIPGMYEGSMVYEVVGLKNIESLKSQLANYVSEDKFSKFSKHGFVNDFKEYNGKVYWCNLGVGDGPYIKINEAKVLSSESKESKIQLEVKDSIGETVSETITITVNYDTNTGKYLITDWSSRFS